MSVEIGAWLTLGILLLVLIALAREWGPPDMLLLGGAIVVALCGVITPEEAVRGFAEPGLLTVAAMFGIAAGLRETGALDHFGRWMFGRATDERGALLRLTPSSIALSAVLNNTTQVAMLLPVVTDWCRRHRVSPSRLLLPLSHLTVMGGTLTLIGTSTNIVVDGMMRRAAAEHENPVVREQLHRVSLFEPAWLGLPCCVLGAAYLLTVGRRLLPQRRDLIEQISENAREYLVNVRVEANCPLIGRTIEQAGLRRLPGLFLVEIGREGRIIAPVEPDEVLRAGDRLTFTGAVDTIVDLERIRGLTALHEEADTPALPLEQRRYCEAVVSSTSPLIDSNVRDANFRARYNAAIVAIHRGGARLAGRVGDIVLRAGDTLLLQAGPHFAAANRNNPDFYLVSGIDNARPVRHQRAALSIALLGLWIALAASNVVSTLLAAMVVAGLMIATRCISASEARRSIQWDVLIAIAASFALGTALERSGAADAIARLVIGATQGLGPWAALAVVYGVTMLLTELLTNNSAAVLAFPLALNVAGQLGVDPRPFALAVMFAASFGFATPMGYQTHLMVYGPGGYRLGDFLRLGIPLDLLMWAAASILIPVIWPLQ